MYINSIKFQLVYYKNIYVTQTWLNLSEFKYKKEKKENYAKSN